MENLLGLRNYFEFSNFGKLAKKQALTYCGSSQHLLVLELCCRLKCDIS